MKIIFNEDEKVVAAIREGLKRKDGYCPCKIQRIPENVCMCEEFRKDYFVHVAVSVMR